MKTIIAMLATLSVIGIVSGGGLAMVSGWADPLIAANKKADTERAIFLVQPDAKNYEAVTQVTYELYRVFDDTGAPAGYSLPWEGNGFQGKVRLMIGVNPDLTTITAIEVLEQVETPGLGTKIAEDPFRGQFNGLRAEPQVDWIKGTPPTKENEVQTITGATISSKAVVAIVNDGMTQLRKDMAQGGAQ
ncbi:MAG: FMN-binding protein [Bacteroidota bacterium]|jgi:electron transport complex protein RnfG|nr:FMN-binding protein [Bacteroidota bacterium]